MIMETAGYSVTGFDDGAPLMANKYEVPDLFISTNNSWNRWIGYLPAFKSLNLQDNPVMMVSANPGIIDLAKDAKADDALEKAI